jgi:hypothetical protein
LFFQPSIIAVEAAQHDMAWVCCWYWTLWSTVMAPV